MKKKTPNKSSKLSAIDYIKLRAAQNNACGSCKTPDLGGDLIVDHDKDGNQRGLLCERCVRLCAVIEEREAFAPGWTERAIAYLERRPMPPIKKTNVIPFQQAK